VDVDLIVKQEARDVGQAGVAAKIERTAPAPASPGSEMIVGGAAGTRPSRMASAWAFSTATSSASNTFSSTRKPLAS
jgi:hypothetical protein